MTVRWTYASAWLRCRALFSSTALLATVFATGAVVFGSSVDVSAETAETTASKEVTAKAGELRRTGGRIKPNHIPKCAHRADRLGLSRVVEIDAADGPRFGDQYSYRGETKFLEDGEVVITFDDGPLRRYTLPILDALDKECTRATFFAVGRMAVADPGTLKEIAKRGHTIATHTWSHQKLSKVSASRMKREIELGLSAVAKATGQPVSPFFRFPYLGHSKSSIKYVQSRGMAIMGIHIDSSDFRTKRPDVVVRNIMRQLKKRKKGILLFHDIQKSTARAITKMLAELRRGGFRVVHIIPKTAAVTKPEYDAIAEKLLKAKAASARRSPVAKRAVTWPVSGGLDADQATKPKDSGAQSAQQKKSKRAKRYAPDDAWSLSPFGDGN